MPMLKGYESNDVVESKLGSQLRVKRRVVEEEGFRTNVRSEPTICKSEIASGTEMYHDGDETRDSK